MKRRRVFFFYFLLFCFFFLNGCSRMEEAEKEKIRKRNMVGERIHRRHDEYLFAIPPLEQRKRPCYPWEKQEGMAFSKITKEEFRCRGKTSNPLIEKEKKKEGIQFKDCRGMLCHSLPIRKGKEFIYPAFIDILNYLQEKANQKVVITCGHRCHIHNAYAGGGPQSKHLLGAEVDFYLKGIEWEPNRVISLISDYYDNYANGKMRLEKKGESLWQNQEIIIKLIKQKEGRDLDNNHKFPYISLELIWDRDMNEPIVYSWEKGFNSYLRY